MKIGEVSLNTNDVVRLANFYKELFCLENGSEDTGHQVLLGEETALTVYNDGTVKNNGNQNISLAFTVEDIAAYHRKLISMGARIIDPPVRRPWGAVNMRFYDPDGNIIYLRQFD